MSNISQEEDRLCWSLVFDLGAETPAGHAEKIQVLARGGFFELDPEDVFQVVWALGREAGRLGITDGLPGCCKRIFAKTGGLAA